MNGFEERPDPYSLWSNCKWCYRQVWDHDKKVLGWWVVRIAFASLSPLILVVMPKLLIDRLMAVINETASKADAMSEILLIIGVLTGLLVILNSVGEYARIHLNGLYYPIINRVMNDYNIKAMRLGLEQLEDTETLDTIQRGKNAFQGEWIGLGGVLTRTPGVFLGIITLLGCCGIVLSLHPLMVAALLILLLFNAYINYKQKLFENESRRKDAYAMRQQYYYMDVMRNFRAGKDIRIYKLSDWLTWQLWQGIWIELNFWHESERSWVKTRAFFTVTSVLQEALLYGYLVYRMLYTGMSIGEFSMYAAAIRTFAAAAADFFEDAAHVIAQSVYISDCRLFFDYQDPSDMDGGLSADLRQTHYSIEFDHVSFRYQGQERWALKDLSLTIRSGERLAVVGLNGAGKTTMIKLMCRLYAPTEGVVRLNGVDIQQFSKKEYFKYLSVVFQEVVQFAFPVAENIAMLPIGELDRERINDVLARVRMRDKIDSLPEGMETYHQKILDEEGIEFSGGQNQRLSLARALYKDAPIIILDEPTAALDPLAEYNLYHDFDQLIAGKTAVYISHRLSSTRFCDHVALFENGRMEEYGTHRELLDANGKYAELFRIQAQYYRENPDAVDMNEEVRA